MKGRAIGLEVVGASGGEELVKCPFHDDHHASATWNPKSELFYCFVCGIGMNLEQLLKKTGNKIDADIFYEEWTPPSIDLSRDEASWEVGFTTHCDYLAERGVSKKVATKYGVEVSGDGERIIFPVRDHYGKTMGIIWRYINPGVGPRYRKSGKQYPIWPMDYLVGTARGEYVIVTEGLFSCLRIASVDPRFRVVALAGAKANLDIVAAMSAFTPIFIYDKDLAGIRAAKQMKSFRPEWTVFTVRVPPDDRSDEGVKKLVDEVWAKVLVNK